MTQGTLSQTGNDLDLAITGEGFFKVLQPDGTKREEQVSDHAVTEPGAEPVVEA